MENHSAGKYTYNNNQLRAIGKVVLHNKGLNRLATDVYNTLTKLNITHPRRKRQRCKRGGRTKHLIKPNGPNLQNLVYPKICNIVNPLQEQVKCVTLNCRSIVSKDVAVGQYLREEKISFALLTETWFSNEKQHQYETSDLNQFGYKLSVVNRQKRIGGGLALAYSDTINVTKLSGGSTNCFEYGVWKLIFKNICLHVIGVYRPPSASTYRQFVDDFCEFMETAIPQYSNLFVTGDFNLHIDDGSNVIEDFNNSLSAMGLEQHVDFSTHTSGHSLDLVITESLNVNVVSCEPGPFISDHCLIKTVLNIKKENILSKTIVSRNYRDIDKSDFSSALSTLELNEQSVETFAEKFDKVILEVLDQHAPLKEKTTICRPPKPWFNENILKLKRESRRRERIWRRYPEKQNCEAFKVARSNYFSEIFKEKKTVISEKMASAKGDSKRLYKLVCELTGTKTDNPLPDDVADTQLAEDFADFFMNKIEKIRQSLKGYPNYQPEHKEVPPIDRFQELTSEEVSKLISDLNTKSCELDTLPTHILKAYLSDLLPNITTLVNMSLQQGVFPDKYKTAIVRPLLKKAGLELQLSNYRPVSNLSFFSKLIEKAVLLRLNAHADAHDLLPKNQSAYRRFHSCESALLRLVDDILSGMENKEVTAMIAIDLSAAFDTVDHDILLSVLESQYGVRDTALAWMDSYLRPRSCKVSINTSLSSARSLECSVPQGSCLGPWLYLAYAGTLFDAIPPSISLYGFADDHIAHKSFTPTSPEVVFSNINTLEQCAITINDWMNQNKLKMNSSKTEFIIFGSRQMLSKCSTKVINIAGDIVNREGCIRYLGAFLDESLSFKEHIKRKCRSAMINYLRIKSIRKYLTKSATETLVLSLVISHLDYCNAVLYGIADTDIHKLQRIQNMSAKLVLNHRKFDSSKDALFQLHWLPIKARITFKMLTYMYNCTHGNAPSYLTELLSVKSVGRPGLRSGSQEQCKQYNVPFNKRSTFCDRSFRTAGPRLWNDLPNNVKNSISVDTFKKNLKTYYFSRFYELF